MRKAIIVITAGTLLGGCAGRYLDLYVARAPAVGQTTQTRLVATLADLSTRAETLSRTYRKASREADLGQLPLIGAAVALGLIALNKPDNAAKTIGRIGIGVGAYTASRSALSPSGGPDVLRRGVDAINCVVGNGSALVGDDFEQGVSDLATDTADLAGVAATLDADASQIVIPTGPDQAKALEAARAAAKFAVVGAKPTLDAAREQLGAYRSAPAVLDNTASTIFTTLAARTSVREVIDSAALAKQWTAAATTATPASAEGSGTDTAAGLLQRLIDDRRTLVAGAVALEAKTARFRFSESLKEVVKCPAKI